MLKKLTIKNMALLEAGVLEFDKGLSVLTGETGAGKSVIVNALSLALGDRGDREHIRFRADYAELEAIFDVASLPTEYKKQYSEYLDNNQLIIYRQIARSGNSKIKINGITSTLTELKEMTAPLAEILGQHANQVLMDESNHLDFLDNFADLSILKENVAKDYNHWKALSDKLNKTKAKREQILKERELLLFQKNEIEKANIEIGEEEQIIAEKKKLDSARTLIRSCNMISEIFENEEASLSSLIQLAQKELDSMAEADETLKPRVEELTDIAFRLTDLNRVMEQYGSSIVDDPERIEEINLRLDEIYKLKKKYGGSEQTILAALDEIIAQLQNTPPDIDGYISELETDVKKAFDKYSEEALRLSEIRKKAADYLKKLVIKELSELAIDRSKFDFEFLYEEDPNGVIIDGRGVKPTANGLESGRIMFSANPGEPAKSLVKTASGGEISRVLLALKSAEKKSAKLARPTMVFDEVDAGIGGMTAIEVGKKLKKLSLNSQLIVITHLHQIAREADYHYVAQKLTGGNKRATITVRKLEPPEVARELDRMVALPTE